MANKRTYINADEELIIQGKLTIEGEFEQRDLIKSSTLQIVEYDGEQLLVNGDGVDETGAAMPGSVVLRSGASNVYLTYNEANATLAVVGANVSHSHNISAPLYTGNVTLAVPRNFTVSGDATTTSAQPFDASSDLNLPIVFNTVNSNVGEFGDAGTVPTFTVNGKGLVTAASENTISITSNNITDFVTAVRGNVSAIDAGGDGSFSYDNSTGVFTYTGPSLAEVQVRIDNSAANVRAHISHVDAGGDGSLSYSSSTGVITYTGPSATEVRAHFSGGDGIDLANGVIDVDSTVVRTSGAQSIAGEKTFTSQVNISADVIPTSANAHNLGSWANHFDHIFGNVVHAETLDLGDADLSDIHNTFYAGEPTGNVILTRQGGGLIYKHTTPGEPGAGGYYYVDDSNVVTSTNNISIAGNKTFTGTVDLSGATVPGFTVDGELQVTGNVNSLNYVDLQVQNSEIILNSNVATATDAQIKVERGSTGTDTYIKWNEGTDRWQFSNDGSTDNNMLLLTDFSATGNITYNNTTGVISQSLTTDDISEGTNLFYTTARAQTDAQAVSINNVVEDTTPQLGGTLDINGQTIQGNLIPSANVTYDLGSPTARWNDLHLNGSTLYLGDDILSIAGGKLQFNSANIVISGESQEVAGTQTFTGELVIPGTSATANGAIYYDNATSKAYIYVGGAAQEITPAVAAGTVEDTGATGINIFAGSRTAGNVTYQGIKSIDAGSYLDISEASNVINIAGNVTQIRGAFTSSNGIDYDNSTGAFSADTAEIRGLFSATDSGGDGSFGYNSTTGVFTYTGPSATEVRSHFSAGTGITLVNGVISATGDNYGSWTLQTDSGAGSSDTITSGETVTIQGGTNITVTNVGNVVTIRNDNSADITGVIAGTGLSGGGNSGDVSLALDFSELTDMASGLTGNDEIILNLSTNVPRRKAINEINLSTFNLDNLHRQDIRGFFSDSGDISYNSTTGVISYTTDISLDTTPQLGGTLDAQNNNIETVNYVDAYHLYAGNIGVSPSNSSTIGSDLTVQAQSASITGNLPSTGGDLILKGGDAYSDLGISEGGTVYIRGGQADVQNGQIYIGDADTYRTYIHGQRWPTATGSNGQVLTTNASGVLSWETPTVGDITGVTAGTGLSGGGTSGTVTLNLNDTGRGIQLSNVGNLQTSFSSIVTNVTVGNGLNAAYTNTNDLTGLGLTTITGIEVDLTDANVFTSTGTASRAVVLDSNRSFSANVISLQKLFTERIEPAGNITQIEGQGGAGNIVIGLATGGSGYTSHTTFRGAFNAGFGAGAHNVESSGFFRANASYSDSPVPGDPAHMDLRNNGLYSASTGDYLRLNTSSGNVWSFSGTVSASLFSGTATSARYADLAEKYESDSNYEAGTVVVFGGEKEITVTDQQNDYRVAGIISTDPAYMMNSEADGQYVALRGRVPCKVIGPIKKGDVLITSDRPGFAMACDQPHFVGASCIVGKALQSLESPSEGVIEVVV